LRSGLNWGSTPPRNFNEFRTKVIPNEINVFEISDTKNIEPPPLLPPKNNSRHAPA